MRILFLSNFYPPASRGGYEQWCQEVLDELRSRGHAVAVLTSTFRKNRLPSPDPAWVYRKLHLEMDLVSLRNGIQFFTHRQRHERENLAYLKDFLGHFDPDVVMIWGMWNIQRSIPALAEELRPDRVVYFIGDYWPTLPSQFENYWNAPARSFMSGLAKFVLKPIAQKALVHEKRAELKFEHVVFPTNFMCVELKQKGLLPLNAKIIYGAIDTKLYLDGNKKQAGTLSLLFIGRLNEEKGIHIAIKAVGQLIHEHGLKNLKFTLVGSGEPDYEAYLHQLVERENIASFVTFLRAQPKEALPALYQQADIFLFTSLWPEPFGRVIVEAMAAGVVVVGAPVGGAAEILIENENALTFTPNDPVSLAGQLLKLIKSQELRDRLSKAGRETAIHQFDIQRMTTEIEAYLDSLVQQ